MVDFMATGRPVILSAAGEAARILERAGGGIVVAPEDAGALADASTWLATIRGGGRDGRAWPRLRADAPPLDQAERLEQVLLDITARR